MALRDLPCGTIEKNHVLAVIRAAEGRRRIVWTAWRVLKEDGSLPIGAKPDGKDQGDYIRRIRYLLKGLLDDGILEGRDSQFNYGVGKEVAYRFISEEDAT